MKIVGAAALFLCWGAASHFMNDLVMASPAEALTAAVGLLSDRVFVAEHLFVSLLRVAVSVVSGVFLGIILGVSAGRCRYLLVFLEPFRRLLASIPGIVAAVLVMLWFGLGSLMVIVLSTVFIVPLVYVNVAEGIRLCDERYVQMADVFMIGILDRFTDIYLPAVYSAVSSSMMIVAGNSVRLVILAEVMGTEKGIGFVVSVSRARMDMPVLYGCVVICFGLVLLIEFSVSLVFKRWMNA